MLKNKKKKVNNLEKEELSSERFIVPVYLNQTIVFDLLAILDDGFSQIRTIHNQSENINSNQSSVSANIGLSNAFTFLQVGGSGGLSRMDSKNDKESIRETKVHTPTSLFSKLLHYFREKSIIKTIESVSDIDKLETGNFVEIKGKMFLNPVIELFSSFRKAYGTALDISTPQNESQKKGKPSHKKNTTLQTMESFENSLKGTHIDFICKTQNSFTSVLQTLPDFFVNKDYFAIQEAEYTVLGKCIMIAKDDNEKKISLLRNCAFKNFTMPYFMDIIQNLYTDDIKEMLTLPKFDETDINITPGLLIQPIAIYS